MKQESRGLSKCFYPWVVGEKPANLIRSSVSAHSDGNKIKRLAGVITGIKRQRMKKTFPTHHRRQQQPIKNSKDVSRLAAISNRFSRETRTRVTETKPAPSIEISKSMPTPKSMKQSMAAFQHFNSSEKN